MLLVRRTQTEKNMKNNPEAKTLGMYYGRVFVTAISIFRERNTAMQQGLNQFKLVRQSHLPLREKKTNALV